MGNVANVQVLPGSNVANVGLVMGYNLAEDKGPKTKDRGWGTKDKGRAKAILCPLSSVLCPFTTGGDPRAAATRKMRVVPVSRQDGGSPYGRVAACCDRSAREAPMEECGRNKLRPSRFGCVRVACPRAGSHLASGGSARGGYPICQSNQKI